jgi:hypothetical protein
VCLAHVAARPRAPTPTRRRPQSHSKRPKRTPRASDPPHFTPRAKKPPLHQACDVPLEPVYLDESGQYTAPSLAYDERRTDWQRYIDRTFYKQP